MQSKEATDDSRLRIGFGCGGLRVSAGRAQAERVIATAIDEGLRHIDVARSYGYGTAESVVGRALRRRDEHVTVVTKVGIVPPTRSRVGAVRTFARPIVKLLPGLHSALRSRADAEVVHRDFSSLAVLTSVETSLRELSGVPIDALLLHEVRAIDVNDELLATLDRLVTEGKVASLGLATTRNETETIVAAYPGRFSTINLADDGSTPAPAPSPAHELLVTHSIMRAFLGYWRYMARQRPDAIALWSEEVGADLASEREVVGLLLQRALLDNPSGRILISTNNPDHVRRAVRAAFGSDPDQTTRFRALVRRELA
jgi:hypothetical protein